MERLRAVQAARRLHKLVRVAWRAWQLLRHSCSNLCCDRLHLLWLLEEEAVAVRRATSDVMHVAAVLTRPRMRAASDGASTTGLAFSRTLPTAHMALPSALAAFHGACCCFPAETRCRSCRCTSR